MEADYWAEVARKRYVELDNAIQAANRRRDQSVEPYRRKYTDKVAEAQRAYDEELKPYILAYEEWMAQQPEDLNDATIPD